jgi:hypothetical protein
VSAPSRGIALRGDEPHDGRRDPEPKGPWKELAHQRLLLDFPELTRLLGERLSPSALLSLTKCGVAIVSSLPASLADIPEPLPDYEDGVQSPAHQRQEHERDKQRRGQLQRGPRSRAPAVIQKPSEPTGFSYC